MVNTCKHGSNRRELADGRCAECNSEQALEYYYANREGILAQAKERRKLTSRLLAEHNGIGN